MKYAEICWHCQFVLVTRGQLKIHSYKHNNICDVISSYNCPCPCHCLKCLGTPWECIHGEEAASGVKIEWLAIVNLRWYTAPMQCTVHTPQIYSDTEEELKSRKTWFGVGPVRGDSPKPYAFGNLFVVKKVDFAKLVNLRWTFVLWSSNINPICIVSMLRIQ